jgi:serine/threonine-protein kinase
VIDGRYHIRSHLGTGGMGEVYRAHDAQRDMYVAIKVIQSEHIAEPSARARLHREVKLAQQIDHPSVRRIYELVETGQIVFVTMEYIEGRTLSSWMRRNGPAPLARGLALMRKVARGVAAAHARGITHRDLTPANIVVTPDDHPVILDFGLARQSDSDRITADGTVMGTPLYMAPEQITGQDPNPRTDVYALALLTAALLTGSVPLARRTLAATAMARIREIAPPLRDSLPDAPTSLDALIARCLAPSPEERPADAGAFADALDAIAREIAGDESPGGDVAGDENAGSDVAGDESPGGEIPDSEPPAPALDAASSSAHAWPEAPPSDLRPRSANVAIVVVAIAAVIAFAIAAVIAFAMTSG